MTGTKAGIDRNEVVVTALQTDEALVPAGSGSTELRLWVRLLACAKMGEKQLRRRFEGEFDTTLPRFDVLAALYRVPGGMQLSALSRALLVSNGNVTVIVRQLQDRGLVKTRTNPRDARSAIVSLTAAGKRQFVELAEAHHSWIAEFLADAAMEDKEELAELLGNLRTALGGQR